MLTSKQRAALRGIANKYETIFQIGHGGITDQTVKQADEALKKREMIKMRVLESSPVTAREAADSLADATGNRLPICAFPPRRKGAQASFGKGA